MVSPKWKKGTERMTAKKVRKLESSGICCHTVCISQYYFKLKFKRMALSYVYRSMKILFRRVFVEVKSIRTQALTQTVKV